MDSAGLAFISGFKSTGSALEALRLKSESSDFKNESTGPRELMSWLRDPESLALNPNAGLRGRGFAGFGTGKEGLGE